MHCPPICFRGHAWADPGGGTASLALQSKAPVWGGDTQPAGTDVVRVAISPQQARDIARACRDAPTELPASGASTCEDEIQHVIRRVCTTRLCSCAQRVCLEIQRVASGLSLQPPAFVQITDEQPGAPLCHSAPGHLCFRLGAQAPVLQVLAPSPTATPSPSSDPTPTPTGTGSPTPTGTGTTSSPPASGTSSPAGT
jgi:hypothetical protein